MKKVLLFVAGLMLAMSASAAVVVAGNGEGTNPWCNGEFWNASSTTNVLENGSITYKDVPAGVYQFKLVIDGAWTTPVISAASSKNSTVEGGNIQFITSMTSDITISYDGAECTLISSAGDFATEVITDVWTIVGDFTSTAWDEKSTAGDMEQVSSGVFVFVAKGVSLEEGVEYQYKAVADHAWTISVPSGSGNAVYTAEATGVFDVTFTLYAAEKSLEAVATPAIPSAIDDIAADDEVVAAFDITGKPVAADAKGIVILQYKSGKAAKVVNY